ncbi:MAG TPA: glycosyltransferase family 2 protein [Chthoniobacterales bacterium]|nr:glycosyltransferase family 2 protein [Chthoniobacterales bacterium]
MRKYLYRKLRDYLDLYVRPGDRIAVINAKEAGEPLEFQGQELLALQGSPREMGQPRLDLEALASFRPDYVVLNGNIHYESDVQEFLATLRLALSPSARVIILFYSTLWKPWLRLATALGLRGKTPEENWIANEDVRNLLLLADYELVRQESKFLVPIYIPLISYLANRFLAPLPGFRLFNLLNIAVARPIGFSALGRGKPPSVSVIVPARNEAGNIEAAILRTPAMGPDDELIFIEGNSTDNTWETICELKRKYPSRSIQIDRQEGKGKGDAVRKGFSLATKEILMILDADLTVPPEELPRFYEALVAQKGEFINGSRLVYPMEKQAMRFFNLLGNKFFAVMFSFVLGQRFKDTLCGTKVLSRENYLKLAAHRKYFGEFDPFGDFDLIFGATRMALRIVEVPIHYRERTYGSTNIERWKHGFILLRMLRFAAARIKFL